MKRSIFTNSQIMATVKQVEGSVPVLEHGMSSATFYKRRSKCGGMDASMMARLRNQKMRTGN